MRITIKNLEIFISPEELKALQNEKPAKAKNEEKYEKPPLKEIFKEEIEAKVKNKIGF